MSVSIDPRWLSRYPEPELVGAPACAFCAIVDGQVDSDIVAETPDTLSFLDHLPATYGHTLVVPKQHYRDLFDIPEHAFRSVMTAAKQVADALRTACSASGINLVHASG